MILQALSSYYERLAADSDSGVAPEGFAEQPVGFCLELSEDGKLTNVYDLRKEQGNKLVPRRMILRSLGKKRAGESIEPNFLWDNATYILGRDDKGKPKLTQKRQKAFYELHKKILGAVDTQEAKAFLKFLETPEKRHPEIEKKWADISTTNLIFRLQGQENFFHDYDVLGRYWETLEGLSGVCLVTGEKGSIARLHPGIKGIDGAKADSPLCSYNKKAFWSFGKEQNFNGPIGSKTALAYATAINYLLRRPTQWVRLGETTVLAWAERPSVLEEAPLSFFNEPEPGDKAADPATAERRLNVLRKLAQGLPVRDAWPELEPNVEMHLLGLRPNEGRISIDFYLTDSAQGFLEKARTWYSELAIGSGNYFPSVYKVAEVVIVGDKNDKRSLSKKSKQDDQKKDIKLKRLSDNLLKAALSGSCYPANILPLCLGRLRSGDEFSSAHAALIKAILIRNFKKDKEDLMSLNKEHPSPAYQLGRLFAILVKVQRKAIGENINAPIKDKFFGSASATPALVFPLLIRNAQNHISKVAKEVKGLAFYYDKLIMEITDRIENAFPQTLSLEEQGLFALGYYHQQADKKVEEADKNTASQGDAE